MVEQRAEEQLRFGVQREVGENGEELVLDWEGQREEKWERYRKEGRVFVLELIPLVPCPVLGLGWKSAVDSFVAAPLVPCH